MATEVGLSYGVYFGGGEGSDEIEFETELDGELEKAYLRAKMLRFNLNEVRELDAIYEELRKEIECEEASSACGMEDPLALECAGMEEVDPEDINDLVAKRDPYTLEFFELTDLSEEELDSWDANDLYDLPWVCDFEEDFEETTPFDHGWWHLYIEFTETPHEDDLEIEEATDTLTQLFKEADGDYSVIKDYLSRCSRLYCDGNLWELANSMAAELGVEW